MSDFQPIGASPLSVLATFLSFLAITLSMAGLSGLAKLNFSGLPRLVEWTAGLSGRVLSECLELSECFLDRSECLFSDVLASSLECRTRSEFLFSSGALLVELVPIKIGGSEGRLGRSVFEDSDLILKMLLYGVLGMRAVF